MDTTDNQNDEEILSAKHGARVYILPNGKGLVKQTVKSGPNQNDDYVIDEHRKKHVNLSNDAEVATAIRDALAGKLPR